MQRMTALCPLELMHANGPFSSYNLRDWQMVSGVHIMVDAKKNRRAVFLCHCKKQIFNGLSRTGVT
jgi:hypothetical protein